MIDALNTINQYDTFALHGGTAINLFRFDYPRHSVDIDLTFKDHFLPREIALSKTKSTLVAIAKNLETNFPLLNVKSEKIEKNSKIFILFDNNEVKIEVNHTNRGLFGNSNNFTLSKKAQLLFNKTCSFEIVSDDQHFGGKVTAALDRQYPRDIFDIRTIMESIDLSEIKKGIMFFLLCSGRPLDELLNPNLIDQKDVFDNAFQGMSNLPFTYEDFLHFRSILISGVNKLFDDNDKAFFISFFEGNPCYDLFPIEDYPSIKWKQINITKLKKENPKKYTEQVDNLKTLFLNL